MKMRHLRRSKARRSRWHFYRRFGTYYMESLGLSPCWTWVRSDSLVVVNDTRLVHHG